MQTIRKSVRFLLVLGAWLAPAAMGCAGPLHDYCQREADCKGGNDADVEACVVRLDADEEVASVYDCADAYSKYWECAEAGARCAEGKFEDGCEAESKAFRACVDAASSR